MINKKLCPVCASENLQCTLKNETFFGDFGKKISVEIPFVKCMVCDYEGTASEDNDKDIEKAVSALNEIYVDEALNFFEENKINFAGIERAIGLPQRTLTKWKNKNSMPTAAGIALLKYLHTFPWLIEVAENKFDLNISQKIFIGTAFNLLVNSTNFFNIEIAKNGFSATTGNFFIDIHTENVQTPHNTLNINLIS